MNPANLQFVNEADAGINYPLVQQRIPIKKGDKHIDYHPSDLRNYFIYLIPALLFISALVITIILPMGLPFL